MMIRGHFLRTVSYLPHVKEPVIRGHLLRTVSYLPHVKEPVMKGKVPNFVWEFEYCY